MPYPVLPGFDTSNLDATKNGQELCNELKRLYDHLMIAVSTSKFKWDSIDYTYLASGDIDKIDYTIGSIIIRKKYSYTAEKISRQECHIKGVPPAPSDWLYVHGQTYNYDTSGNLVSQTNTNQ